MRKRILAVAATLAVIGGGLGVYAMQAAPAGASIPQGNFIDVGCVQGAGVLVYTVTNRLGAPTGAMSSVGRGCRLGSSLDLQPYVRARIDGFGNVVVTEYRSRFASGAPIAINVVPGWARFGPPFSWDQHGPSGPPTLAPSA